MDCKDCAESVDDAPGGSCCWQCSEEGRMTEAEAKSFKAARDGLFKSIPCPMCAKLEAALDGILDYAQEALDDDIANWGTYHAARQKRMQEDIQRAREALAGKSD